MRRTHLSHWTAALLAALLIASCSQSPTTPTASLVPPTMGPEGRGQVQGSATGDVKNGPIEIDLVRVSQADGVPAFYAMAGGDYVIQPEREVEIYVQIWRSDPALTTPPRVIVDWGVGSRDNIHCGPCRLSQTYSTEGRYRVTVTMDDRAGGTTMRTFTLDSRRPAPDAPTPAPTPGLPGVNWTPFNFAIAGSNVTNDCASGAKWAKQSDFDAGLFVGAQLCTNSRYKLFLSSTAAGPYWEISDQAGSGEDHCELIGGTVTTAIGPYLDSPPLPSGFYRSSLGDPFVFATPPPSNAYRVPWYECGISIPGVI